MVRLHHLRPCMTSDRTQRQVNRLLDEAEAALAKREWQRVRDLAGDTLALDPSNADARSFLAAAERALASVTAPGSAAPTPVGAQGSDRSRVSDLAPLPPSPTANVPMAAPTPAYPAAFAGGRYIVKRFLGEGGKKRVYLAHDTTLDRDVAFALIKTNALDIVARSRITREAQSMGRLGSHPHIVTVFELGEVHPPEGQEGQPYMVTELMGGGDVEGAIGKAPEHKLPLERALKIAIETCRGLEFAHGKEVVHRDLKPGNVWLTADETAKIGDFGLAVALDRSRLTAEGMMVGTVAYMPPEQATGGE
ncbi:MAG: protein kinase, partial [Chloroflexi bacterium]|nr:protein kinase [Chloroflexota bacterium]